MKKFSFLVLLVLSVFATNAFAGELDVWGGYTKLNGVDKLVSKGIDSVKIPDDTKVSISGDMDNAFTVGLDYFFGDNENAKPGFRVDYLRSGEKKMSSNKGKSTSIRISLSSAMFGGRANYDISEKFSLNGKLFVGIASVTSIINTGIDEKNEDLGYCFVVDPSVGAQYLFTEKFGLGLDLGYRLFSSEGPKGFTAKLGLNFKI
ncbi:hypothetical protein AGMMS49990_06830 [Endomicrobiia bacterium]|nr:hypothetical protein AGMMS49990_06830 [Endomicrobiia bacterium]